MQLTSEHQIFFVGAGAMGEAMIKGLLTAQLLTASQVIVSNRRTPARLQELSQRYGVQASKERASEIARADMVILAVKPFDLVAALNEIAPFLSPEQLIISVAAGVSTATIEHSVGTHVPVIRAMPNTSSFVQASATALCAGRWATEAHLKLAQHLFSAIGISLTVEEAQMNAATGLSGTGPAYFYYVVEALLEAGQSCGLPEETTRKLLIQTLYGSAKMLQETGQPPSELRRQVTSPNGTTMAGIAVLEQGGAQQLFIQAVQKATQRAAELGQQAEGMPSTMARP
ncbi:MAG TPA: pyrroline-5-carboxylate reductase [Ktedonobacteraceae bacterium]|nr:pyrroline-5-carboxylate reductase [Ktedonobacteraceae bacterium]